jgi:hypothetical protein
VDRAPKPGAARAGHRLYIVSQRTTARIALLWFGQMGEKSEILGEFSTIEDANEFIRRMCELDAGPSHGSSRL